MVRKTPKQISYEKAIQYGFNVPYKNTTLNKLAIFINGISNMVRDLPAPVVPVTQVTRSVTATAEPVTRSVTTPKRKAYIHAQTLGLTSDYNKITLDSIKGFIKYNTIPAPPQLPQYSEAQPIKNIRTRDNLGEEIVRRQSERLASKSRVPEAIKQQLKNALSKYYLTKYPLDKRVDLKSGLN